MKNEIQTYLARIEDLRGQVLKLISGLPPEALDWRPIPGSGDHATNSIAVLTAHIAGAEQFWIGEVAGGLPATRDRQAEFDTLSTDAAALAANLAAVGEQTRSVLAALTPAGLEEVKTVRGKRVSVRWGILHVIDHTSLHLGHMQLTYQLWNHGRAQKAPRWFERV